MKKSWIRLEYLRITQIIIWLKVTVTAVHLVLEVSLKAAPDYLFDSLLSCKIQ